MLRGIFCPKKEKYQKVKNSNCASVLVAANFVPSTLILSTLMIEAICASETSVVTRATRLYAQEDSILHSHRRRNLKS
jgi:hypothetical protein